MSILDTKQFLFVIGSPRSGTTWLKHMLASHPHVVSSIETTMYAHYLSRPLTAWEQEKDNIDSGRWIKGVPALISEEQFDGWMRQLLEMCYTKICESKSSAHYILDKAPENSFQIKTIRWFIPDAKFVHIIRDGRDVVCSMRNVKRKVGHQTENIAEGATNWKMHVEAASGGRQIPSNYMEVRYENLLSNPFSELSRIFAFCGIYADEKEIVRICDNSTFEKMRSAASISNKLGQGKGKSGHYHKGKAGTWEEELSKEDLRLFCEEAGDMLVELGYADKKWVQQQLQRSLSDRIHSLLAGRLYYLRGFLFGTKHVCRLDKKVIG